MVDFWRLATATGSSSKGWIMNKSRYITTLLVAASSMGLLETQAFAENQDADMKPIVFMVLDTSGTMNNLIDADKNETRLTAALGEIIGSSKNVNSAGKLVRMEDPNDHIYMPFPIWSCQSGTCKFEYNTKKIEAKPVAKDEDRVAVKIARPSVPGLNASDLQDEDKVRNNAQSFNKAYYDNGIIQAYQSLVKFGFAGMAVGSNGSTSAKDSAVKAVAAAAGGAVENVALRFTLVWNDRGYIYMSDSSGDYVSQTDLDAHCYEYRTGSQNDHICYYQNRQYSNYSYSTSNGSYSGGLLDVDIVTPRTFPALASFYGNRRVGVENIFYNNKNQMKINDEFDFQVHLYSLGSHHPEGYRAEIAFEKENSCTETHSFDYPYEITSSQRWYPVAKVRYEGTYSNGKPKFKLLEESIPAGMKHELSGSGGEPLHIYGYRKTNPKTYGRELDEKPYKSPSDCSYDIGMWDSSIESDAPLVYPTVRNEDDAVIQSNQALIEKVRTYMPTASTPIGEVLADLYYMFGLDDPANFKTVADKSLVSQELNKGTYTYDDYYPCRKKAVVFISDGTPNGSGLLDNSSETIGHSKNVWHDSYHLFKKGVPVYVVGYAEFVKDARDSKGNLLYDSEGNVIKEYMRPDMPDSATDDERAATILNKMAWKGGTCYNEEGKLVEPDKEDQYNAFVSNFDKHHKYCFINAGDGAALRKALSGFMSDITKSIVSKTRIVNTTAISYYPSKAYNNTLYSSKLTSGYYNVYSGYNSTLGNITRAILYRKATLCQDQGESAGNFTIDPDQELDMAKALKTRLSTCAEMKPGATPLATCLRSRYIFTGDYATDRYKLTPDIVPLSYENHGGKTAGLIANAVNGNNFNYLVSDVEEDISCNNEYNKPLSAYTASANYILSPYECVNDFDCNVSASEGSDLMCELGRCTDKTILSCNNKTSSQMCIAGMAFDKKYSCTKHADCRSQGPEFVCHAGECLQGTVTSCDARSFVANQPLGRIEYATPVVVEPPTRAYRGHNYAAMSQKYWDRDTMLLTGANDGMLHAFVLGSNNKNHFKVNGNNKYSPQALSDGLVETLENKTINEGQELWGFIPKSVLPTIQRLTSFEPNKYVNASPVVQDVLLPGNVNTSLYPKDTFNNGKTNVVNAWRTVVVGGFRDGARGYYALDITDPAKPRILWEIGPTWQPSSAPTSHKDLGENAIVSRAAVIAQSQMDSDEGFPFLQMGYTYAEPIITYATTSLIDGKATIEPVAILPGGVPKNNDTTTANDETGKVLYVVRLFPNSKEDLIVKTFHFDHAISGSPQVYPSTFKSTAQLLYFGDDVGNLYRINLKGTPDKWASNDVDSSGSFPIQKPVFKATSLDGNSSSSPSSDYEKIVERPAVARFNKDYAAYDTIQIAFGSGSNENFVINSNQKNYIAVFYDVPDNLGNYTLNPYDKNSIFNPTALVFSSKASGTANIQGTDKGKQTLFTARTTDPQKESVVLGSRQKMTGAPIIYNFDAYFPAYVADNASVSTCGLGSARIYKLSSTQDKFITTNAQNDHTRDKIDGDKSPFEGSSFVEIKNTRLYGLSITKQMTCLAGDKTQRLAPQLVAMTGQTTDSGVRSDNEDKLMGQTTAGQITTVALNLEAIQPVTREAKWATVYE